MILIFCAFGREFAPLRAGLKNQRPLQIHGVRGLVGQRGNRTVALIASGIGVRRARDTAAQVLDQINEVKQIVITGVAGALHRDLRIGDIVVAERLWLRRGSEIAIEHALEVEHVAMLTDRLNSAQVFYTRGAMLTSREAIVTAADKRRVFETLGALSVDMESAVIAHEASLRGIPFVCLRAILDNAEQDLEAAMLADDNGRVRPLNLASAFMRNPRLIGTSLRLMRDLKIATAAMTRAIDAVLMSSG